MPVYSPFAEADMEVSRSYSRLSNEDLSSRISSPHARKKPWVYMDCIDSIINTRPDVKLVVGDGRTTDSIRSHMQKHCEASGNAYHIELYDEPMSQWLIFNDILKKYTTDETEYFIYTSSDVIWLMDWVAEAEKEFAQNSPYQLLFPCVNSGDPNLPCQVAPGPRDMDPIKPPYQEVGKAPVLNAYVMIFRMDFFRKYGGYPTIFRNCFTESFLSYMCDAIGGQMRLMPRGWCHHYGTVDLWTGTGSAYYYNEEKMLFQDIMNKVLMRKSIGLMTLDYLKETLYRKD